MDDQTVAWAESLSDREYNLARLLGNRMNDAVYSSEAYFNMMKMYERRDQWINWCVIFLAGLLTVGSVWERVPTFINFGLAVTTGVVSFLSTYTNFNHKAIESEQAGDSYNEIIKEFQAYYYFVLKDESYTYESKKRELERLLDRYQEINRNTMATDESAFEKVDREDIRNRLETTSEELELLFSDHNIREPESTANPASE